jgi:hypothetical protein
MPAMKHAFQRGIPAIAPAPMTPRPDAAKTAIILSKMFLIIAMLFIVRY